MLLYVTVLLLCILLHYIATGCPPLNLEHQFRRAEKAQWVGPAEILGSFELKGARFYDRVLLAEDRYGTTMYLYREDIDYGELHYRQKTDKMQVLAVPAFNVTGDVRKQIELPIIVFDRNAKAVRAEMELVVDDGSAVQTYYAEAERENEGYFCFIVTQSGWGAQIDALRRLSQISGSNVYNYYVESRFPIAVRLYDENGKLIHEERSEIVSASRDAQKEANS